MDSACAAEGGGGTFGEAEVFDFSGTCGRVNGMERHGQWVCMRVGTYVTYSFIVATIVSTGILPLKRWLIRAISKSVS